MRYLFLLLLLFGVQVQAQEEAWTVVERCLGDLPYPTIPQSQWDFEGVIFSRNTDGLRAIRADVETPYYVAFYGGTSFAASGELSPDGQWFAYLIGESVYGNMVARVYIPNAIRVVSTNPFNTEQYQIPWYNQHEYASSDEYLSSPQWIDSERLVFYGIPTELEDNDHYYWVINPFTDEIIPAEVNLDDAETEEEPLHIVTTNGDEITLSNYSPYSPDGLWVAIFQGKNLLLLDIENEQVLDLCLETPTYSPNMIWSPDSQTFAFLYDGYPILVDINTFEMQILRYTTDELIGWFPVEEE